MGDHGLKTSLDGHDVKTATPDQLAQSTAYTTLKIQLGTTPAHFGYQNDVAPDSVPAGVTTLVTVAHGYDYIPAHFCVIRYTSIPGEFVINLAAPLGSIAVEYYSECDATNFYFKVNNRSGGVLDNTGITVDVKYYIFVEDGD